MDSVTLSCGDERRRQDVRDKGWNGIDDVEVHAGDLSLCVHVFGQAPDGLVPANVRIDGGRRIRNVKAVKVEAEHQPDPELEDCLRIKVDRLGDFSTYTLHLVALDDRGQPTDRPLDGFDPRYAQIPFSFRVDCPSDLDCAVVTVCPPTAPVEPEINYLAKDYDSFRQLILDRLALIMPDWQESHAADLGITLVELLAYAGDYLSYYQDAVATEAYLGTARQRISVRRHTRLVDYHLHEGCNARAWVHIATDTDTPLAPADFYLITSCAELDGRGGHSLTQDDLASIPSDHYDIFEPLDDRPSGAAAFLAPDAREIHLYKAHNRISFYTWGDTNCCLPRGATTATLRNDVIIDPAASADAAQRQRALYLKPGDLLLFEEALGPKTGQPADADPTRRCVVRLTAVTPGVDELYGVPIVEIEWASADALPFALCLSSALPAPWCTPVEDVSVARGNVILVDHGATVEQAVPPVDVQESVDVCLCDGSAVETTYRPETIRPLLDQAPITFSQPVPPSLSSPAPAASLLAQDPRQALPQILLTGLPSAPGEKFNPTDPRWRWEPRYDLLSSGPNDQHFVAEIDNDGRAHLRFGDDNLGRQPEAHLVLSASYRTGNGPAGNVGAETITYIVFRRNQLNGVALSPRNPLPARGGTDPEPVAEAVMFAPYAYRSDLQRAVTAQDYARIAERNQAVQRAAAQLSWTGSWYAAQVAIDALGVEEADAALLRGIDGYLYRYRRMGHDLAVGAAHEVPLDLELDVCVLPHYLRGHVEAALLDRFSNRILPDGTRGFFHPDNLTFGQGIAVSALVAAAQMVPGVASVSALLRRYGAPAGQAIDDGILALAPTEVAQLDNDPDFPEHGTLTLKIGGGR